VGGAVVVALGLAGLWYVEFAPNPERQNGFVVATVIVGLLIGVRQWLLQAANVQHVHIHPHHHHERDQ
jgi:hypothetical protein